MQNTFYPYFGNKIWRLVVFGFIFMMLLFVTGCSSKVDAHDYKGNPIKLSDYKGKWVVINYWATWCKPCLVELPELNTLYASSKGQIMVIGVNYDQLPNSDLQQFAQKYQLTFPLVQNFSLNRLGVEQIASIPATFLIAPNGRVSKTLFGPQTADSLRRAMSASNDIGEDKYLLPKRSNMPKLN